MELEKDFSPKALEDFRLIDSAINDNDESAYAELMKRYRKPVYHMILKMVRNVDDAEDLTIEAFAKAFKNLHRFKKDYTFSTWLFRIATNNSIDFIRKKRLDTMSLDSSYKDDDGESVSIDVQDQNLNPQEVTIKNQITPLVYAIKTSPMAPENTPPENFSLLGLHKDIHIYIDPDQQIPVRISGTNNSVGKIDLELQNAEMN